MLGNSFGFFFGGRGALKIEKRFQKKKVKNKYLPQFTVLSKQAFCPCPVLLFLFVWGFSIIFFFLLHYLQAWQEAEPHPQLAAVGSRCSQSNTGFRPPAPSLLPRRSPQPLHRRAGRAAIALMSDR